MALQEHSRPARRVTIRDVAAEAQVAVGTASNVLRGKSGVNAELRERVLAAAEKLSYRPNLVARSLKSTSTQAVGVIVTTLENPVVADLVQGIESELGTQGYSLLLATTYEDDSAEMRHVQTLLQRQVDGLVVQSVDPQGPAMAWARDAGVPVVLAIRGAPSGEYDTVVTDGFGGAVALMRHLVEHGYRRIAHVGAPETVSSLAARTDGYVSVMREVGGPLAVVRAEPSIRGAYQAGRQLLREAPPGGFDAIMSSNDLMAYGVLEALGDAGLRVPEDVAVVGLDNAPYSELPGVDLTSVSYDFAGMGHQAAEMLLERIAEAPQQDRPSQQRVLSYSLIVRRSCGCETHRRGAAGQTTAAEGAAAEDGKS